MGKPPITPDGTNEDGSRSSSSSFFVFVGVDGVDDDGDDDGRVLPFDCGETGLESTPTGWSLGCGSSIKIGWSTEEKQSSDGGGDDEEVEKCGDDEGNIEDKSDGGEEEEDDDDEDDEEDDDDEDDEEDDVDVFLVDG
jgi:hypothetical protein